MLNSPLREAPRNQRAAVIPLKQETSLLDWLQSSGRLISRDIQESERKEDKEDITDIIGVDENSDDYEFDEDSDDSESD